MFEIHHLRGKCISDKNGGFLMVDSLNLIHPNTGQDLLQSRNYMILVPSYPFCLLLEDVRLIKPVEFQT